MQVTQTSQRTPRKCKIHVPIHIYIYEKVLMYWSRCFPVSPFNLHFQTCGRTPLPHSHCQTLARHRRIKDHQSTRARTWCLRACANSFSKSGFLFVPFARPASAVGVSVRNAFAGFQAASPHSHPNSLVNQRWDAASCASRASGSEVSVQLSSRQKLAQNVSLSVLWRSAWLLLPSLR